MKDFIRNLTKKVRGWEVKMCQTLEPNKIRRNFRNIEVIVSKVELWQMRKEGEATVLRYDAIKPTTAKIEANHMTCHHIACNPIPWTATSILFPVLHFWIMKLCMTRIIIRSTFNKGKVLLKLKKCITLFMRAEVCKTQWTQENKSEADKLIKAH